jgi:hypothetical protein
MREKNKRGEVVVECIEINLSLSCRDTAISLFENSHVMPVRPSGKGRLENKVKPSAVKKVTRWA